MALALPGEGGRIACIDDDNPAPAIFGELLMPLSIPLPTIDGIFRGELLILLSLPPPSIEVIVMPLPGRCGAKPGRSRTPANGDAIGGPRGADARCAEAVGGGICGGEGGGMLRVGKGGGGGSRGPACVSASV